jgi:hypothetical protein
VEGAGDEKASEEAPRQIPAPPPIGVRLGEALEGDQLRIAYRWERSRAQGLQVGQDHLSPGAARDRLGFGQTPRSLEVTVHTFEVAYAPHPRVTLVAALPFVQSELERVDPNRPPGSTRRQEQTDGVGDLSFAVVVPFIRKGFESSQVHVGVSAPTGSFRRGGDQMRLPYDVQPGGGTWNLEWGWTYKGELERFSWGGQATGVHPVGRNDLDWRDGSRFAGQIWGAVRIFSGLSASLSAEWWKQNNIEGFDRSLRPAFDPSENPKLRGGNGINLAPGLSLEVPGLSGQRLALEVGVPVYQDLDGPQLTRKWSLRTGWQWVY